MLKFWTFKGFLAFLQRNNKTTRFFPETKASVELFELVERYQPHLVWSDGDVGK